MTMRNVHDLSSYLMLVWRSIRLLLTRTGKNFALAGVLLSFSRIMQTVAFFMPLKVLIVLSSDGGNKYSAYVEPWLTDDQFLALIIAMVPISYGLYITFGIAHRRYFDRDLTLQIKKATAEGYDKKQLASLKKIHPRLTRMWADSCVITLITLAVLVIQPFFAFFLLALISGNLVFFNALVFDRSDTVRLTPLRLHPVQFVEYATSINYLLVFGALALAVYHNQIGIVTALLALLLSRLCLQAVQRVSLESRTLKKQLENHWNIL